MMPVHSVPWPIAPSFDSFRPTSGGGWSWSAASDAEILIPYTIETGGRTLKLTSHSGFEGRFRMVDSACAGLEDGWAGPGSVAPTGETFFDALIFLSHVSEDLPPPMAAVAEDGEILLEWDDNGRSTIVSFVGDGTFAYTLKSGGRFLPGIEIGLVNRPVLPDDLHFRLEDIAQRA